MRTFKTGTVARRVGITPTLLRVWETRYGLVSPSRGPGGQRLYAEADVELLAGIRQLVDRGFAIGEVASWSREEIRRTLRRELRGDGARAPAPVEDLEPELEPAPRRQVLFTLDAEGVIVIASPNAEVILGWPHGLLVGQPIWGLLVTVPPALESFVGNTSRGALELGCSVWMRRRDGQVLPFRLACTRRRRVQDGTSTSVAVTPLFDEPEGALHPLLESVDYGGLVAFRGTREEMFQEYATTAVEAHDAALARVWTYDAKAAALHLVASNGLSRSVATSARSTIKLASYRYKVGVVARSGVPFLHHGLAGDVDFDRAWVKRERLESAAVLPIVEGGRLVGVTAQFFRHRLSAEDVGRIQAAAALCESWVRGHRRRARDGAQDAS